MNFQKQGDWLVSTPIIAGSGVQVAAGARCDHEKWLEGAGSIEGERLTVVERCGTCCATRVKVKDVS